MVKIGHFYGQKGIFIQEGNKYTIVDLKILYTCAFKSSLSLTPCYSVLYTQNHRRVLQFSLSNNGLSH